MDDKQLRNAQLIVSRAKIQMRESHPFYAHILTHLAFELTLDTPGGVSATDGKTVFINPIAYLELSKGEQVTVLAHEQFHCLDGHLWRTGARDKFVSNVAQDIYIYHVLKSEGFAALKDNEAALTQFLHKHAKKAPSGYAYDLDAFEGMFWEQIYEAIVPPSTPKPQSGDGDGEGDDGQPQPGAGQPKPSSGKGKSQPKCGKLGGCYHPQQGAPHAAENREQWKQWIREAGVFAKMAGCAPGRWQELVDAATPPVPFETRFFEFLKRGLGGDQTFDSFARRHLSRGVYLPTDIVEQMGETVLVCDTSGSRNHEDRAYAYGVFRSWRAMHPCRVHVVDCDTECHWRTFEEYEELPAKWEAKGRGGTAFAPPFHEVAKRQLDPTLLVFFTDGYLFDHDEVAKLKPPYQTIWCLTGQYDKEWKAPFGEMVRVARPDSD